MKRTLKIVMKMPCYVGDYEPAHRFHTAEVEVEVPSRMIGSRWDNEAGKAVKEMPVVLGCEWVDDLTQAVTMEDSP